METVNINDIVKLIAGLTLEQWVEITSKLQKDYGIEISSYFYHPKTNE